MKGTKRGRCVDQAISLLSHQLALISLEFHSGGISTVGSCHKASGMRLSVAEATIQQVCAQVLCSMTVMDTKSSRSCLALQESVYLHTHAYNYP